MLVHVHSGKTTSWLPVLSCSSIYLTVAAITGKTIPMLQWWYFNTEEVWVWSFLSLFISFTFSCIFFKLFSSSVSTFHIFISFYCFSFISVMLFCCFRPLDFSLYALFHVLFLLPYHAVLLFEMYFNLFWYVYFNLPFSCHHFSSSVSSGGPVRPWVVSGPLMGLMSSAWLPRERFLSAQVGGGGGRRRALYGGTFCLNASWPLIVWLSPQR